MMVHCTYEGVNNNTIIKGFCVDFSGWSQFPRVLSLPQSRPELHFIFECLLADPLIDNPPVVTGDTRQNLRVCFFPGLS